MANSSYHLMTGLLLELEDPRHARPIESMSEETISSLVDACNNMEEGYLAGLQAVGTMLTRAVSGSGPSEFDEGDLLNVAWLISEIGSTLEGARFVRSDLEHQLRERQQKGGDHV